MAERISIGTVLVMREEFARVAGDDRKLTGVRHRAEILVQLLDELIAFREKEATSGHTA